MPLFHITKIFVDMQFMWILFQAYFLPFIFVIVNSKETTSIEESLKLNCHNASPTILHHHVLMGGKNAGNYTILSEEGDVDGCIKKCCGNDACHLILLHDRHCIGVECFSRETCKATDSNGTTIVYIKDLSLAFPTLPISRNNQVEIDHGLKSANVTNTNVPTRCETGLMQCKENEICVSPNNRRRDGFCQCTPNYIKDNNTNQCIKITNPSTTPTSTTTLSDDLSESTILVLSTSASTTIIHNILNTTTPTPTPHKMEKLVVSITNKTVQLSQGSTVYEHSVTLSAYAIGATECKYEWTLLDHTDSDVKGSVSDPNTQTITLSQLVPGVYVFRVTVDAPGAHGEATGNVTVLSPQRANSPPVAVIVPPKQVVKLPNSGVILDGSGSTDDKQIESYQWEIVTGPLGYMLNDESDHTLKLNDLIPGNYTIMLRVTDSQKLEGNTTALVTVVKETDYPPSANAGGDQIIYLPQNETVLNGNASSDDHGIVEWEWTKGPEDSGKAVDMQDTRTPYLRLGNLKEGHYHFLLKVVDNAGHTANSSAHVYVQEPNLASPVANAGSSLTVTLPNNSIALDAVKSTNLSPQTHYLWSQLSGPSKAIFVQPNDAKTMTSGLTKGIYLFRLTLWLDDDKMHNSTANVSVTVLQNENIPPVANAGGDFSVTLPASLVVVNGSGSKDDVSIVRWCWQRDPTSLAAAEVINHSNTSAVLMLTGVVAGRYVWKLTVYDDQGASSSDSVSIIVKEGPHSLDEVEVVIGVELQLLTQSQLSSLLQKLQLLLHTSAQDVTITLITLYSLPRSGRVSLVLLGKIGNEVIKGPDLASQFRQQVTTDANNNILDLKIISVETVICQNNCSGHGECIQSTGNCRCHSWWMESFFRRHMGDAVPNCDWSVVYVFVVTIVGVVASTLIGWLTTVLVVRQVNLAQHRRMRQPRYSLLDPHDDTVKGRPRHLLIDSGSGSDSESEALFDARKARSKIDKQKNGYFKLQRIRT